MWVDDMENYEALSNFEINKLVASKLALDVSGVTEAMNISFNIVKDYCNSWADMGPIAMDNNIVITPCMGINKGDATRYFEHENSVCSEFSDNKGALRAAAIVYLMMGDDQ